MARDSKDLAKYIIYLLSQNPNYSISNTKIQKLLYSYVGFAMASKDNKISKDEIINELPNAWDNGPMFPSVYKFIKNYNGDIKELGSNIGNLNENEKILLEKTVNTLGKFSAGALSNWSHLSNSPWDTVYNIQQAKYKPIPLELIKEYFEENVECIEEFANV